LCGLSGGQGQLGQAEGRTADDAAYWLAQAPAAWRDAIEVLATGMCSIYASTIRRMLPAARLVDLFHVVQLAVKVTGDVRRRAVREKYRRRGRSGDREYGVKGLLATYRRHTAPRCAHRPHAPVRQVSRARYLGISLARYLGISARLTRCRPARLTGPGSVISARQIPGSRDLAVHALATEDR